MTLREIAMYCKIKQSKQESDEYKQQANLYESVLTGTVTEFIVPSEWTEIKAGMFYKCAQLSNVTMHDNIIVINSSAFSDCDKIATINISLSCRIIYGYAFNRCNNLSTVNLPASLTSIEKSTFANCVSLTNVTLGYNFNCDNLDLSASTKYSVNTLVAMLTALADRSEQTAYTLTLGATNLAKLSDEQKAIATDKNWTLA